MLMTPVGAVADEIGRVVVSIKPIHSLVAAVMEGVGEPYLIVKTAASPHSFSMKPSDARALERAEVVFWVGEELETFLQKSLETLALGAKVISLRDTRGLIMLKRREGGPFDIHDHGEEQHGDHEQTRTDTDMHLWLDPVNAKAITDEIERTLSSADPDNADRYRSNARTVRGKLDSLVFEVGSELAPVADRPFIVFHDAYQYFEKRFGVTAAGSLVVNPMVISGAARLTEMQSRIKQLGATCVFAEPQFTPRLVRVVTSGTGARARILDPLGADLADGPALYFELIRGMAKTIRACLMDTG